VQGAGDFSGGGAPRAFALLFRGRFGLRVFFLSRLFVERGKTEAGGEEEYPGQEKPRFHQN
jgi:hypothetical protein